MRRHDIAVVGLGLVGSAALRHLAAAGADVVGVGPGEPSNMGRHDGPFASHYDSGRITRRIDARREWAVLASRSIAQYPIIEERSGVRFHEPAGLIFVRNDASGIANQRAVAAELGIPITVGSTDALDPDLSMLSLPPGWTTLREPGPAGHVDPRRMAAAQLDVARQDGASTIDAAVLGIDDDGTTPGLVLRLGPHHGDVAVQKVLIATGPYQDVVSKPLQATVRPEAVVLGEVDAETVRGLGAMPSIIHLLDHEELDDVYVVPPVRYPDGRWYVKMGGSHRHADVLRSAQEKRRWMTSSDADVQLPVMRAVLQALLPDVTFTSWSMKPCLITDTSTGLPFVDQIDERRFLALGGNGHAAKSSDALGALAARLLLDDGRWTDPDLSREAIAVRFGSSEPAPGSRHGN